MTLQAIVPLLAVLIAGISLYYQREQLRLMRESVSKKKAQSFTPGWKFYWPMVATALLALSTWGPFVLQHYSSDDVFGRVVLTWGGGGADAGFTKITVKPSLLVNYQEGFRLAGICFLYSGLGDALDETGLQKSALRDIENGDQLEITIPLDVDFRSKLRQASTATYAVLIVPKHVRMDQFSTLRQAQALGGKVIWHGTAGLH
jgi:hypothetical protein